MGDGSKACFDVFFIFLSVGLADKLLLQQTQLNIRLLRPAVLELRLFYKWPRNDETRKNEENFKTSEYSHCEAPILSGPKQTKKPLPLVMSNRLFSSVTALLM